MDFFCQCAKGFDKGSVFVLDNIFELEGRERLGFEVVRMIVEKEKE